MWCSFLTFFFIFRTGHSKNVSINFHINCLNARIGICAPLSGCVCEYLCLSVGFSVGVCIYNCTFQTLKSICTYQQRNCLLNADCVASASHFFLSLFHSFFFAFPAERAKWKISKKLHASTTWLQFSFLDFPPSHPLLWPAAVYLCNLQISFAMPLIFVTGNGTAK